MQDMEKNLVCIFYIARRRALIDLKKDKGRNNGSRIAENMRNGADQAIAGFTVNVCIDYTVNEDCRNIINHQADISYCNVSCGKSNRRNHRTEPERKYFHRFANKKPPKCNFFTQCRNDYLTDQQGDLIKRQYGTRSSHYV